MKSNTFIKSRDGWVPLEEFDGIGARTLAELYEYKFHIPDVVGCGDVFHIKEEIFVRLMMWAEEKGIPLYPIRGWDNNLNQPIDITFTLEEFLRICKKIYDTADRSDGYVTTKTIIDL